MARVYHVVFSDDVDGIISAAIYLHDHIGSSTYRLYPISSTTKGDKIKSLIKSMRLRSGVDFLVILNCENHEKSNLWIDRHWSRLMGDNPVKNSSISYNPQSKSTSRLVKGLDDESIKNSELELPLKYDDNFLDMVDIIAKSDYKSVDFIFNDTHPLMILRAYVERNHHSDMMFGRIVEMISKTHFDFRRALYQLRLNRSVIWSLRKEASKIKGEILIIGNFSVLRQSRPGKFPRYSEFYIFPKMQYSLRLSTISRDKSYFQIGFNKWGNGENNIDIGKMISRIGYLISGGGNYGAGGGIIKTDDCERFLDDLSLKINKEENLSIDNVSGEEPEMEKLGVDENDPIEKNAKELVKEGEAKDISEGREKASEPKSNDVDNGDEVSNDKTE